jgi:hypothetical protein
MGVVHSTGCRRLKVANIRNVATLGLFVQFRHSGGYLRRWPPKPQKSPKNPKEANLSMMASLERTGRPEVSTIAVVDRQHHQVRCSRERCVYSARSSGCIHDRRVAAMTRSRHSCEPRFQTRRNESR